MSLLTLCIMTSLFQGGWEPLPNAPLHELDVHLASNPAEKQILRYGTGKLFYSNPTQTIWNGQEWVRSIPGMNLPSTEEPLLTYDPVNKGILLFGGARLGRALYEFSNVTRLWKNGKWRQLFPKKSPSPRYVSSFTTDTKRKRIVFWAGGNKDFIRGWHYPNETWEWDGKTWNVTISKVYPTIRWRGTLGYDPLSGHCFLFGGTTGPFGVSVYMNDLWEWDGKTWKEIKKTKGKPWPSIRGWTQRLVFHPKLNRLLLVGGVTREGHTGKWIYHSDTWAWNGLKRSWSLLHPEGSIKGFPQIVESVTVDPVTQNLILIGRDLEPKPVSTIIWGIQARHQTWIHDGKTWKKVHEDPVFPENLIDVAWDPKGDRYLGINEVAWTKNGFGYFRLETWEYKPGKGWKKLVNSILPKIYRVGELVAWELFTHEASGTVGLLANIQIIGGNKFMLFYKWDSRKSQWVRINSVPPYYPIGKHKTCYDRKKGTIKIFDISGTIWDWSPSLGWKVLPGVKIPKNIRSDWDYGAGICYDELRDRFVLVKRRGLANKAWDNWEWDRKTWKSIPGPVLPTPKSSGIESFHLVYVPPLKKVLLVGGKNYFYPMYNNKGGNTLTYSWDGKGWVNLKWADYLETRGKHTAKRTPLALFFDRNRQQLVSFHSNSSNHSAFRLRIGGLVSLPNFSRPGGRIPLEIQEPSLAGQPFALGFSLSSWPGLPFLDSQNQFRRLPLAADALFLQTFGMGTLGLLDSKGGAKLQLPIPPVPSLAGLNFFGAGIILNQKGVLSVTNAVGLHVTR